MKSILTSLLLCFVFTGFSQLHLDVSNTSQCDYIITFFAQDTQDGCSSRTKTETFISGDQRPVSFPGCSGCEITAVTVCSVAGGCCVTISQNSPCVHCTPPGHSNPTSFSGQVCPGDPCEVDIFFPTCNDLVIQ